MRADAHCCTSKLILSADAQIATFLRIRQLPRSTRRQCEGGSRAVAMRYFTTYCTPSSSRSVLQTLSPRKNGRGPVEKAAGAATRPR